jgi:hypothetical protein
MPKARLNATSSEQARSLLPIECRRKDRCQLVIPNLIGVLW